MPSTTEITVSQLSRLVGLPNAPTIIDVRVDDDVAADPRLLPCSVRRPYQKVSAWTPEYAAKPVIIVCQKGMKVSQGVAAWMRHEGIDAQTLEGGFEAWRAAKELLVRWDKLPPRDEKGRTVWVTRARPKVDRIACPWLIRRFIDANAVFLFVAPSEVTAVAERFKATPFDIEGVLWSHRGQTCTFDTMIQELELKSEALLQLALIVRGADTAKLELAPQSAGLLAASLGYSRMFRDDIEQLEAAMSLYDAYYRWCRDAVAETHNWPSAKTPA